MSGENLDPKAAQVPPAAAAGVQQPEPKKDVVVPPAPAAAPAADPAKAPEAKKEGAAADPGAAAKDKPNDQPNVVNKDDLKLPEGSLLSPQAVEAILALAKEKNLSKEQAQVVLDRESNAVKSYVEGEKAKLTQMQDQWYEQTKADKELGGEAYDANVELGHRVFKKFVPAPLEQILKDSGMHEHPEVVRFFVRLGKAMAPDQLVMPNAAGDPSGVRLADRIYGKKEEPAAV